MVEAPGFSEYQLSPTGWRRRSWRGGSRRRSSRSSTPTPMAIDRSARPSMRWRRAGSAAGDMPGSLTSTWRSSSTACPGSRHQSGGGAHRRAVGAVVHKAVACRPAATARRDADRARPGNPAGLCCLARAGKPVHAPCVRPVDSQALPGDPFERYADDAVVHCATKRQADAMVVAIGNRMAEVGLRLHPTKTRVVYCKGGKRQLDHEHTSFTFLGSRSVPEAQRTRTGLSSPRSCPESARTPLTR